MGKVQYSFYRPLLSGYQDVHIHVQWLYDGWKLGCPMTQNSLSLYLGFRSNVVARMNRFVPYSYKDNIARTYYGTVNISYEPACCLSLI